MRCILFRKNESNRKKNIAADVLGGACAPSQQFTGGMGGMLHTSFDGNAIRNQVAYAFKNRSIVTAMPPQIPQQQQNAMGCNMGMQPMMYGGMEMQPMMQGMPMQGMNWGAANFCMNESNGEGRRHKKSNVN